jgi:hypothetical protein
LSAFFPIGGYAASHKNVPKKGGGISVVPKKRSAIGTLF